MKCELTPLLYDPITFDISPSSYIVICEDVKSRKYYVEHFKDIVELREEKLNQLGI